MSSNNDVQYASADTEEWERMREQRCIDHFMRTGIVPCVCLLCGSVVVHRKNLKKHVLSRRCVKQRRSTIAEHHPHTHVS